VRADIRQYAGDHRKETTMTSTERVLLDGSGATGVLTPTLADFPITTIEKLRFTDTDCNGHITNTVFAVCCQNARMELLCDPQRVPIPCNSQFVIAKLLLEFRAEMHWPGTVEIGTGVERIGRSSLTLTQALFVRDCCSAVAESVVALVSVTTRHSIPLPVDTVAALRAFARSSSYSARNVMTAGAFRR
jgi:acyl-CoA thioester hydrolase